MLLSYQNVKRSPKSLNSSHYPQWKLHKLHSTKHSLNHTILYSLYSILLLTMSAASNSTVGAAVAEEGFAVPQSLQSSEQKMLLNIIDTLRSWDVGSFADLPQLIVCGIQSSGKSSVMVRSMKLT